MTCFQDESTLIVLRPQAILPVDFFVMVNIFPVHVWAIVGAVVILCTLLFYLVARCGLEPVHQPEDSERFGISNAFAVAALLALQREYPRLMQSTNTFKYAGPN